MAGPRSRAVPLYHDRGVVLRTYKLGEADRIVSILTRGHGKVRAVAKGVRKTKSRFGGRLEPASHVDLLLYEGRGELDIVSQAETIDHFRPLRDDLDRLARAVSMLEAADQLALEREANARLYEMLVGALRTLAAQDAPLVRARVLPQGAGAGGLPAPGRGVRGVRRATGRWCRGRWRRAACAARAHRQGPAVSPDAVVVLQDMLGGRLADRAQRAPAAGGVRGGPPGGAGVGAPPRAAAALGRHPRPRADGA